MLRQLAIHNIVLVERLEIDFEPGLGVLTGETGAGKSILLDALGLALGSRADSGASRWLEPEPAVTASTPAESAASSATVRIASFRMKLLLLGRSWDITDLLTHGRAGRIT